MKKTIFYIVVALVLLISTCFLCSCTKTCEVCGGTGEVECPDCEGFGYDEPGGSCSRCGGDGTISLSYNPSNVSEQSVAGWSETCPECDGTGSARVTCPTCNGAKTIVCEKCNGQGKY